MTSSTPSISRILLGLVYGASIVIPGFLLLEPQTHFAQDWPNHLWIIDYYGSYVRHHGVLPEYLNPDQAVGAAIPVFYGCLFYSILGVLTAAIGLLTAVRLAVFATLLIQFCVLMSAGRRVFGQTRLAYLVAASVIWGTYALTNLYNRGALAEYFATSFVVTSIGFGTLASLDTSSWDRWFHGWLAGFFLVLAIGTHPPTTVLTGIFLVLLVVGWQFANWRRGRSISLADQWRLGGVIVMGALILGPWAYACARFASKLVVSYKYREFVFRPDHSDTFWGRFAPFPYDAISTTDGANAASTPYLEAPVNFVLLGLLLWNLELCRRSRLTDKTLTTRGDRSVWALVGIATGWFVLLAVISLSPSLAAAFQLFAPTIQFVYRLVSHCNAALLVGVLASGVLIGRSGGYNRFKHQTDQVIAAGLAVAVIGLGVKMQHAAAVALPGNPVPPVVIEQLARAMDYTTAFTTEAITEEKIGNAPVLFFPGNLSGSHFGEIGSLRFVLKEAGWVRTDALFFPWLEITSDGMSLPAAQVAREGPFYAIYLTAGRHVVQPVWRPDPVWSVLHRISQVVFALLILATAIWSAMRAWPKRAALSVT